MSDILDRLKTLYRPRILISAARRGATLYCRDRDLRQILRGQDFKGSAAAILLERESEIEETRQRGDGTYSAARHIAVLTALMVEASLLRRPGTA